MNWTETAAQLPPLGELVALINIDTLQNEPSGNYPLARIGILSEFGSKYWSCYGERAMCLDAYTHWCSLPDLPADFTSQFEEATNDPSN